MRAIGTRALALVECPMSLREGRGGADIALSISTGRCFERSCPAPCSLLWSSSLNALSFAWLAYVVNRKGQHAMAALLAAGAWLFGVTGVLIWVWR